MSTAYGERPTLQSTQFRDGQFHNAARPRRPGGWQVLKLWWQFMFKDVSRTVPPEALPVTPLTPDQCNRPPTVRSGGSAIRPC